MEEVKVEESEDKFKLFNKFKKILDEYGEAYSKQERQSKISQAGDIANYFNNEVINDVKSIVSRKSEELKAESRTGQFGNMAEVPWIKIMYNKTKIPAPKNVFIACLFNTKKKTLNLTLMQTAIGKNTLKEEKEKVIELAKKKKEEILSKVPQKLFKTDDLVSTGNKNYNEYTTIMYKEYTMIEILEDEYFIEDLYNMMDIYEEYYEKCFLTDEKELSEQVDSEESELMEEDNADMLLESDKPESSEQIETEKINVTEKYDADKFLEEVFMERDKYNILVKLLKSKKNIILQGSPGVGKTYAAKRLVYSLIGRKDEDKIKMIQFHQNYSYEDFIMGFRPEEDGSFKLRNGIFHNFCSKASKDKENAYYFIIDEINRGNLSKIFGELLMLIESDKRGVEFSVPLTYKQEEDFHVPENVHIIGMMNTADRSLAIMDYALRRRFCFIEIEPAFKIKEFENHLRNSILHEGDADKIIKKMIGLNKEIEEDSNLGKGFKIGHSYFCNPSREEDWYKNIIEYEINPLIEEYWFDDDEKVAQIKKMISDSNGN